MADTSEDYCRSCAQTVHLFQGKWKMNILCAVRESPVRLGQLSRAFPAASKKVLTENLRELEEAGLIVRREYDEALRHVEYDLREDFRDELNAMIDHLASFGKALRETLRGPSATHAGPQTAPSFTRASQKKSRSV